MVHCRVDAVLATGTRVSRSSMREPTPAAFASLSTPFATASFMHEHEARSNARRSTLHRYGIIPCIISMHQRPHSPSSPASPLRLSGCSIIRPAKRLSIQLWLQQLLAMQQQHDASISRQRTEYLRAPWFLLRVVVRGCRSLVSRVSTRMTFDRTGIEKSGVKGHTRALAWGRDGNEATVVVHHPLWGT